jgi:hypothetical protein
MGRRMQALHSSTIAVIVGEETKYKKNKKIKTKMIEKIKILVDIVKRERECNHYKVPDMTG